ncbi:MAG: HlyC/CorC family transporter [Chlamydiia bacterium]|nr:HlyC/CorC family transporter [Chlamydiia bacterium]
MILLLTALLIVLLSCSAFFSASETSLFSLSPLTLKSYKTSANPRLFLIARLMEHPRDVLVTILIFNVLANLLVQNTVSSLFDPFPHWIFKVGIPLFLTLVFGEVLPKSIAMPNNTAVAYRLAPWIDRMARVSRPIRNPLTRLTNWISRFLFFFLSKEEEISTEELRHMLKTSEATGVLMSQECDLIAGALDLQESLVKERMRSREEILFYDIQEPLDKLLRLFVDLKTTRVPVCDGTLDHLLGVLSTRRFFLHQRQIKTPKDLIPILKKPYYVPESTRSWLLLKNLRERGESLAMVVDEYGSIAGLISQEDLIESVVGEIADLRDTKSLYTRSGEDVIIASGKLDLSQFREIFGLSLESDENIVTLGGWLTEQLGDIPVVGTKYANDQFFFYVLAADPNRVRRIYVRRLKNGKRTVS